MAKSTPIQTSFSGGEFGPHVEGRVDAAVAATGLETCQNYIPTIEGPLVKRPGSLRVAQAKDPSKPPIFIPFLFSSREQYLIEAGENYFRFFTDGGRVLTSGTSYTLTGAAYLTRGVSDGTSRLYASRSDNFNKTTERPENASFTQVPSGSILEIGSPYDWNMLRNVSFTQKGDTLWIFHSSIPTHTLQRFGPQDWDLKQFRPKDGPYWPLNSNRSIADVSNAKLRINPVGPGPKTTLTNLAGELPEVKVIAHSSHQIANVTVSGSTVTVFIVDKHAFEDGDFVYIHGAAGTLGGNINDDNATLVEAATSSSRWQVRVVNASSFTLVDAYKRIDMGSPGSYAGSGKVVPAIFYPEDLSRNFGFYYQSRRVYGAIKGDLNPAMAILAIDKDSALLNSEITGTSVIPFFQFGAHNVRDGWPSTGTFHQNRLVLAGVPGRRNEFAASKTNEFDKFSVNEASSLIQTAKSALQFELTGGLADGIIWAESAQKGLYFGTNSAEFLVSPSREGEALTPTNINNEIIGEYGSSFIKPARQGDAIIYIQSSRQKLRELRFFENLQAHRSQNLLAISDHQAFPEVLGLATQKEFHPLVWSRKSDGRLASLSYQREESQTVAGWASHVLGGQSDPGGTHPQVKSIAVMRNSSGVNDQLWMAVQRYINGTSTVEIEYLAAPYRHRDPNQKQRDAYFLDCGAIYDSSAIISNITTGSALITAANHGFLSSDFVFISNVSGLNSSYVNTDGVVFNSNLVNEKFFAIEVVNANSFLLKDWANSSYIVTNTYSPYFSGGKVRKLVSSISGLTWLKNETVGVWADGKWHPDAVVNSGGILALSYPAAIVAVGHRYKARGKSLVKDSGSKTGSAVGQKLKTYKASFRLKDTLHLKYGPSFDQPMHVANFGNGDEILAGYPIPLFSGIHDDGIEMDYNFSGQVAWEDDSPAPSMIQSITYFMDEVDQ